MNKVRFGIIGVGSRGHYYTRIAQALPDRFEMIGAVARTPERGVEFAGKFGAPVFPTIEAMLDATAPDFVVTAVDWDHNAEMTWRLVERGVPVLGETPPATTMEELLDLWDFVQRKGGKVQIAEHVAQRPHQQAQLALVRRGLLGTVTQAQISVAHGYHGIGVMRDFLGLTFENATVSAKLFTAPLVQSYTFEGPAKEEKLQDSPQQFFWFDFDGKLGLFDFTYDQYWSPVRAERVLVRGERGELFNESILYLKDLQTPVRLDFVYHYDGHIPLQHGHTIRGIQAGGEWVYENPCLPAALTPNEISGGAALLGMAKYLETGEDFYSLAKGSQDHYLYLLAQKSLNEGVPIKSETMPWAK